MNDNNNLKSLSDYYSENKDKDFSSNTECVVEDDDCLEAETIYEKDSSSDCLPNHTTGENIIWKKITKNEKVTNIVLEDGINRWCDDHFGTYQASNEELNFVSIYGKQLKIQNKNAPYNEFGMYIRSLDLPNDISSYIRRNKTLKESILNSAFYKTRILHKNLIRSTQEVSYVPAKNGVIRVTCDDISLIDYDSIDGYYLASNNDKCIQNNDFTLVPLEKLEGFSFYEFLKHTCTKRLDDNNTMFNNVKFQSLLSGIGYLLHDYKDMSLAKLILLQEVSCGRGTKDGGTGKSIITKSLDYIRETVLVSGRTFSMDKNFILQNVTESCKILLINDLKTNFDFSSIFDMVTENIEIERKFQTKTILPFKDSPKMVLTSNEVIKGLSNNSVRRRVFEIVLENYYNDDCTPRKEFGIELLESYNSNDLNLLYNLLIHCIQVFLKHGLIEDTTNDSELEHKRLVEYTDEAFVKVMENHSQTLIKESDTGFCLDDFSKNVMGIMQDSYQYRGSANSAVISKWLRKYIEYLNVQNKSNLILKKSQKRNGCYGWKTYVEIIDKDKQTDKTSEITL